MRSNIALRSKQSEKSLKQGSFPSSGFEDPMARFNSKERVPVGTRISEHIPLSERIDTLDFASEKRKVQWKSTDEGLAHINGGKNRIFRSQDCSLKKVTRNDTHLALDSNGTNLLNSAKELEISEEYLSMRDYIP